jgi:hypothetical protein
VFFGLAFSLLLIALYPQRKSLVPSSTNEAPKVAKATSPTPPKEPKPEPAEEPEKEASA